MLFHNSNRISSLQTTFASSRSVRIRCGMSHESLDQPESGSKRAPSGVNESNYDLILINQLAGCHSCGARDIACSIGGEEGSPQNTNAWLGVSDKKSKQ